MKQFKLSEHLSFDVLSPERLIEISESKQSYSTTLNADKDNLIDTYRFVVKLQDIEKGVNDPASLFACGMYLALVYSTLEQLSIYMSLNGFKSETKEGFEFAKKDKESATHILNVCYLIN